MKNQTYLFTLILFALVLTACGEKESKEDVINKIEEKIDEVENYDAEMNLQTKSTDSNDAVVEENKGSLEVSMHENTLESSGEQIENEQKVKYYSTEEATYVQENDGDWEDRTDQEEEFQHIETSYSNVAQILVDLKDKEDVEMEKKDGKFIFTFSGQSEEVYKAFEQPYSLSLMGADVTDVEHDLKIIVDNDTYFINELNNNLSVEIKEQMVDVTIAQSYAKINEIDDIKIPQEVIVEVDSDDEADDINNQQNNVLGIKGNERTKIMDQIKQQTNHVNSYKTDIELTITVTDITEAGDIVNEKKQLLNVKIIKDPFQISGKEMENDQIKEFYGTKETKYFKDGEQDWQDVTDNEDMLDSIKPTYRDVGEIIPNIENESGVSIEKEDGKYMITFKGKSESIYTAFEGPYSISLTGLKPKDMTQEITIVVDEETHFVEHLKNVLIGTTHNQELEILVEQTYEAFNEHEEITVPQEVLDQF